MATKTKFEPKELVLAKMNGYPAWPAFVMPAKEVPSLVLKAKKKSSNYCVIFIPDGDYYWMSEKNLTRLSREKLSERVAKVPTLVRRNFAKRLKSGRTNNVNEALLAAEDADFDLFIQKKRAEDDDDDDDEDEEDGDGDGDVEEEAAEEEEEEEGQEEKNHAANNNNSNSTTTSKSSTRRRVKAEADATTDTSEPTETLDQQLPPTSRRKKRVKVDPDDDHDNGAAPKRARNGTTSTSTANGDDSPELSEEERQKQLWQCRIKLQRTLIQRNQPTTPKDTQGLKPPSADELSMARFILNRLKEFPVTLDLLRQTKIHKVLKCITKDADLEYADLFKLHERLQELLTQWDPLIQELKKDRVDK